MPRIRVKTGPNAGRVFEITQDNVTIGRDENQTIQILDQGVSRQHAEVFRIGEMVFLRDCGSRNGTWMNRTRITEEMLRSGDEILIGATVLVFEEPGGTGVLAVPQAEIEEVVAGREPTTTVELDSGREKAASGAPGRVGSRLMAVLEEVGQALGTQEDPGRAIEQVLEVLVRRLSRSQAMHLRLKRATGEVVTCALAEAETYTGERRVSRTILRRVVQSGRPLLSTDASVDERFQLSESVVLQKIKSVIAAPLRIGPEVADVLYIHGDDVEHALTPEDLELVGAVAQQLGVLLAAAERQERIRQTLLGALEGGVRVVEAATGFAPGHARRTADCAVAIATELGYGPAEIDRIRAGAFLHDIGRALAQEGHSEDPQARHVLAAEPVLEASPASAAFLPFVRFHHRRADGSGQPRGVRLEEIPREARIVLVACAFDARSTRPGPSGRPPSVAEVVRAMAGEAGTLFDQEVVRALVVCHRKGLLTPGVAGGP